MLTIGDKFPKYEVTATVGLDLKTAFETITDASYAGKWKVYFFWPKDFTFVCPTEIAAFGKLNSEFADRDAQVLGGSIDTEFVHLAWRNNHPDLKDLPFPMLADIKRELTTALGILTQARRCAARHLHRGPGERDPLRLRHRRLGGPQPAGGSARTGRPADRRTVPLQLAQGRRHAARLRTYDMMTDDSQRMTVNGDRQTANSTAMKLSSVICSEHT